MFKPLIVLTHSSRSRRQVRVLLVCLSVITKHKPGGLKNRGVYFAGLEVKSGQCLKRFGFTQSLCFGFPPFFSVFLYIIILCICELSEYLCVAHVCVNQISSVFKDIVQIGLRSIWLVPTLKVGPVSYVRYVLIS